MGLRDFTLANVVSRNARLYGDRPAFIFGQTRVTHGDYAARVKRLAAGLAQAGIGAGDRVAILSHNNLEFVDLYGAMAWLGAILVPINWRLSADEIAYIVSDASPKIVIADAANAEIFRTPRPEFAGVQAWYGIGAAGAPFRAFDELGAAAGDPGPTTAPAHPPLVMFHTAAVGGKPRGALLAQSGLMTGNVHMAAYWSLSERDVNLGMLPLFHLAGLNILLGCQHAGGASVIAPKFDAAEAVRAISDGGATLMAEFAPMLGSLLDAAKPGDLANLRVVTGLDTPETIARFEQACPHATFWVAFGQSETSGFVTSSPFRERPGSAGKPMFLAEIAIVDDLDQKVATGATGEIVVRGPCVFEGYWNCDEDTKHTFRNDWHHTGDLGAFDADGYLFYKGRSPAKELIKPGGENVYPAEVEAALREHAAVVDAYVFGVPDAEWGEAIKAVCVLAPGASATAKEITDFVAGRIARYKRPKHLVLADSLPKTASGAVDRAKAKEAFANA